MASQATAGRTGDTPDEESVFDQRAALAYAGGDRALLAQVVRMFRADTPTALRRLEKAIRQNDDHALRQAAHALKGVIATVGSASGREMAAQIERLVLPDQHEAAQQMVTRLTDLCGAWTPSSHRRAGGASIETSSRSPQVPSSVPESIMKKILVVDDDQATRHLLRKVLTSAGFTTTAAKDGVEALKLLRTRRVDLLLLDVWMPRMNGLDLLAKLEPGKARPRVVVMTSDEAPETLLKAVREQAFKYVHKPVESIDAAADGSRGARRARSPAGRSDLGQARVGGAGRALHARGRRAHQTVMAQLDTDLAAGVRESIGYAFRELLLNAVEWGGRLDPKRKVRIACLRVRADADVSDCRSRTRVQDRGVAARGHRPSV